MTFISKKPRKPLNRSPWNRKPADHARLRRQRKALKPKRANEADSIMSRRVRENADWICARCHGDFSGRRYLLTNSHFITRQRAVVRYDDENCDALCTPCHVGPKGWETQKKGEYRDFKLRQLGAAGLAALEERAKRTVKLADARREFMESVRRVDAGSGERKAA